MWWDKGTSQCFSYNLKWCSWSCHKTVCNFFFLSLAVEYWIQPVYSVKQHIFIVHVHHAYCLLWLYFVTVVTFPVVSYFFLLSTVLLHTALLNYIFLLMDKKAQELFLPLASSPASFTSCNSDEQREQQDVFDGTNEREEEQQLLVHHSAGLSDPFCQPAVLFI